MAACTICGKTSSIGSKQKHGRGVAGRRWAKRAQETKRTFKPNIQTRTFLITGKKQKMNICTSCLKRVKKYGKVHDYSNIALA